MRGPTSRKMPGKNQSPVSALTGRRTAGPLVEAAHLVAEQEGRGDARANRPTTSATTPPMPSPLCRFISSWVRKK